MLTLNVLGKYVRFIYDYFERSSQLVNNYDMDSLINLLLKDKQDSVDQAISINKVVWRQKQINTFIIGFVYL